MSVGAERVALIGFGEVGQILADDLRSAGFLDLRAWDRLFPVTGSEPHRAVRARKFLREASSLAEAADDSSIVICAVTADQCVAAAREAAAALSPGAFYFDLNSVSPATKKDAANLIEAAGGCYVEAVVMSAIGLKRSATPMWLGGPHADRFLSRARSLGFTGAAVYSDAIGAASAVKMCRSVVIKGI